MHVTGERRRRAAPHPPHDKETSTHDLLRVVRTKKGPAVFVRGERLRHIREIEDRETGQDAISAIRAVLAFAEGWLPTLQGNPPSRRAADRQPGTGDPRLASTLQSATLVNISRTHGASSSQPLKLVEEIDALIQKRLEERPDLARKGVRLTHDVEGHPLIYVGRERYRSADEIPDDELSTFVRETIQMWEGR